MDAFRFTAVVLSIVLGLAVARILSGFVTAFRARGRVPQDWLPLMLAAAILGELVQFWWALAELAGARTWSAGGFGLLVALILLLYLAAALIVPPEAAAEPPRKAFERDGRWAMAVLGAYHLGAIVTNCLLFGEPLVSASQAVLLGQAALALAVAFSRARAAQALFAVAFVATTALDLVLASRLSYG
jgi:hypothetical protein